MFLGSWCPSWVVFKRVEDHPFGKGFLVGTPPPFWEKSPGKSNSHTPFSFDLVGGLVREVAQPLVGNAFPALGWPSWVFAFAA